MRARHWECAGMDRREKPIILLVKISLRFLGISASAFMQSIKTLRTRNLSPRCLFLRK